MRRLLIAIGSVLALGLGVAPASAGPAGPTGPPQNITAIAVVDETSLHAYYRLSWQPPSVTGGATITGYEVFYMDSTHPIGTTVGTSFDGVMQASALFIGSTTVGVRALTDSDPGEPGFPPSYQLLPAASAPQNLKAETGDGTVKLSWDPPATTGFLPLVSYEVFFNNTKCTTAQTSCSFSNLPNGASLSGNVRALGTYDIGGPKAWITDVVPGLLPSAPQSVTAKAGVNLATVTWKPPASSGGMAISAYKVKASSGNGSCETSGLSCTVKGLSFGQKYAFTVTAVNAKGTGPGAVSNQVVTPKLVQKAEIKFPKKIAASGPTVLVPAGVRTNAGKAVTTTVKVRPARYAKLVTARSGKVAVTPAGGHKLTVRLKVSAPETATYQEYLLKRKWVVPAG